MGYIAQVGKLITMKHKKINTFFYQTNQFGCTRSELEPANNHPGPSTSSRLGPPCGQNGIAPDREEARP